MSSYSQVCHYSPLHSLQWCCPSHKPLRRKTRLQPWPEVGFLDLFLNLALDSELREKLFKKCVRPALPQLNDLTGRAGLRPALAKLWHLSQFSGQSWEMNILHKTRRSSRFKSDLSSWSHSRTGAGLWDQDDLEDRRGRGADGSGWEVWPSLVEGGGAQVGGGRVHHQSNNTSPESRSSDRRVVQVWEQGVTLYDITCSV